MKNTYHFSYMIDSKELYVTYSYFPFEIYEYWDRTFKVFRPELQIVAIPECKNFMEHNGFLNSVNSLPSNDKTLCIYVLKATDEEFSLEDLPFILQLFKKSLPKFVESGFEYHDISNSIKEKFKTYLMKRE